jgi:hypothetical protein
MGTAQSTRSVGPRTGPLCSACGQLLAEEITRYKTMGIFVPLWKPAPCRNSDCPDAEPHDNDPEKSSTKPAPLDCLHRVRSGGLSSVAIGETWGCDQRRHSR